VPVEPRATYRVQLHEGFTFDAAAEIADYLDQLGISHLYTSPVLQAAPGSTHGYDVVDHGRVNEELGGSPGHAALARRLRERGMGQLLDVVPNHMAIVTPHNRWWWDVLENGPSSRYAAYFDVDWDPPEAKLRNTVLLPVLEDQYGRVLEKGLFRIRRDGASFTIHYHDHQWPVAPRSLESILALPAERLGSEELAFLASSYGALPGSTATDVQAIRKRHRHKEVLRGMLERLCAERPEVARAIDQEIERINTDADLMDGVLEKQNFRPAFWRAAERDLGYRRFFDINTLVGLRVELERVFFDTHGLVLGWLDEGTIDGLRIDHPDGLRQPGAYLHRLRTARPNAWVVVEKILMADERLPGDWPVEGTTGYDFMVGLTRLFVDPAGELPLTELYAELTGEPTDFEQVLRDKKLLVLREVLGSDVNRLTALLLDICERHRRYRDHTRHDLQAAVRELIADFPVYRTYVRPEAEGASAEDERYVTEAVRAAKAHRPDLDARLFELLGDLLLHRLEGEPETEFVQRFQQVTGPAMAKGGEDTAFYTYNRLVSLNEVGGHPGRFGLCVREFHRAAAERQWHWARSLLATSTHDSKRSEDVRARINVLSEMPARWAALARRWFAGHQGHWGLVEPDRNLEYLLYQTLVGAWPIERERLQAYVLKAAREAKSRTSWTRPDERFEAALATFVDRLLDDAAFRCDLELLVAEVTEPGRISSLAQVLLKLTSPGVPDIYQGTELWDLSLVDPDNRRPVDYATRRRLLAECGDLSAEEAWARMDEGVPKLWTIAKALCLRRRRPEAFGPAAEYAALEVSGAARDHVVAFRRGADVAVVVPRLVHRLGGRWEDTAVVLPEGRWRGVFTDQTADGGLVAVSSLFRRFPVALLAREGA
jgi:(1->4)-alpha-D-glucan 1-alpha-D-glucosylmutase